MALSEGSSGLGSSLTDLMTSLAVIFILLLVVSLNNAQEEIRAGQVQSVTTRNEIIEALRGALREFSAQGVRVEADPKDPLGIIVLVPEGLLKFERNLAIIPQIGMDFLKRFVPELAITACSEQFRKEINSIVVEGHTDSTGHDRRNLPLSQARSMAVVLESLSLLSAHDNEQGGLRGCFLNFLSATGRGSADPIFDDLGREDQDRSRRVVFKIRVRSLEQRQELIEHIVPSQPMGSQ
jgi:outer membrane protein OmpA-like peptidoglycan-associated protein